MDNIHFGMPTLIELNNINECVDVCLELGLDFFGIKWYDVQK